MFDVNVFVVQRPMSAILPHFRRQGNGTIIQTSSYIGRITTPFLASYSSSKYTLEPLAKAYRAELSGFGIQSCIVEPGGFPTGFMSGMITPSDTERMNQYGEMAMLPETSLSEYVAYVESIPEQRPKRVAEVVTALVEIPFG
jgi:NADP-dependent 3-hydroxy acid dehydrogenase YdfG